MIYVYFSYSKDECMLAESVKRLRTVEPEAVVYIANDERDRAAVPAGCHEVLTRYDRGGSGTGLPAVEGELLTMKYILECEKADYIVKVDSDVWLNDVKKLRPRYDGVPEPDFLGYETGKMLLPTGAIYRLSKWAVKYALETTQSRWMAREWNPQAAYSENLAIFHMVCLAPTLRVQLIPWATHGLVGMPDSECVSAACRSDIVHCGEPLPDGTPVTREHALCRMYRLKKETQSLDK